MITDQGERYDSETRSFRKYLITIIFIFMLLIFLRKQKEDEEGALKKKNKKNLRQNENYQKHYPFGYIRELDFIKYESLFYVSPNKKFLTSTYYIDNYTIHIEGYDNIYKNFENLALNINKKDDFIYIFSESDIKVNDIKINENLICVNNNVYISCAKINTILVDKNLYKLKKYKSCNKESKFCLIIFVELDKEKCYNFKRLSHSCHANYLKNENIVIIKNNCYIIIATSNISKIYFFIRNQILLNDNLNENTETEDVQIISHFCGNLLNQIATIDIINFRLLFIQKFIHLNHPIEEKNNKRNQEQLEKHEKEKKQENINNYLLKNIMENKYNFEINYYLTIIDLSENNDIVQLINFYKLKESIYPPIHLGYDEQSNVYYIMQYETSGSLTFIFISTDTLNAYYTLKIKEFYSGWLLNPSYSYENKGLMLIGEYTPYEDELHIWNINNFQHDRYFINFIKIDSSI